MKRCIILLIMASMLFSCHDKKPNDDEAMINKGDWLMLLFDEFGMECFDETEINWYSKADRYYAVLQTGIYWNIIPNQSFNLNEDLDYSYLIQTIYRTMYPESTLTSIEEMQETLREMQIIKAKSVKEPVLLSDAITIIKDAKMFYYSSIGYDSHFSINNNLAIIEIEEYETISNNQIKLDDSKINVGDLLLLEETYFYVTSINENIYDITVADYDQIIDQIQIQDSFYPDLSKATIEEGSTMTNLTYQNFVTAKTKEQLLQTSAKYVNFEIGDLKVTGSLSKNNMNVKISGKLNDSLDIIEELSISNLKLYTKLNMDKLTIKEGLLQMDYKISNQISLSSKKYLDSSILKVKDINELKERIKNDLFSSESTSKAFDLFTINIPIASTGHIMNIKMVVGINVTVNGEISLTISSNQSNGIEIINNKVRFINESTKEASPLIEGSIDASSYLKAYVTCFNKKIMNVAINFGLRASAKLSIHYVDLGLKEVEQIYMETAYTIPPYQIILENQFYDTCLDVSLSWLLRLSAGEKGTIMHQLGLNFSYDFLKNKDPIFSIIHIEGHKIIKECQRNYLFYDMNNEGKQLDLSSFREIVAVGESKTLTVKNLNKNYSAQDLIWESSNPSIATVNQGIIKALSNGDVIITVRTKDDLYYAECYVSVEEVNLLMGSSSSFFFS